MKFISTFWLISLFCITFVFAQEEEDTEEQLVLAEEFIDDENFADAIKMYQKLLEMDSTNADLNFKIGFCYLNTVDKSKSIDYLERTVALFDDSNSSRRQFNASPDVYYYLGKAYHVNGMYEKAIETLNALKFNISSKQKTLHKAIDRLIMMSQNSLELKSRPVEMRTQNLGSIINSAYTDHSPVFSGDEKILIFTSRREGSTGGKLAHDGEYFEDLYISRKDETGNWTVPANMGKPINTKDHEASISLSFDGSKLFIYKSEEEGSIFMSENDGDDWTEPRKLGPNINTRARETHASLSVDGTELYFTSDRKGGFGGMDIYVSHLLPDGTWGEAKNLGPTINTEYDEEGPYIHPDGTLYFASQGHKNMGGFDIFYSRKNEFETWEQVVNIGYPINTTGNDVYFTPTFNKDRAFYSTIKKDSYGRTDIYEMYTPSMAGSSIALVKGKVVICDGDLPPVSITVTDDETEEIAGIYKPNAKTGDYLFILQRGISYIIEYETMGEVFYTEELSIARDTPYEDIHQTIPIPTGLPCDKQYKLLQSEEADIKRPKAVFFEGEYFDEQIEIQNILFPFGKTNIPPNNPSLDTLANYLLKNLGAIIEVGAYADAIGSESANLSITQRRAQSVVNYLVSKGVPKRQLKAVGYGESNPIAINQNPDGTWNRDAQQYNRRIEFRIIEQGKLKLLVKPIDIVPEKYKHKDYVWRYK